jgi:hypothetical protein
VKRREEIVQELNCGFMVIPEDRWDLNKNEIFKNFMVLLEERRLTC